MTSMRGSLSEAPWTLGLCRVAWTLFSLLGPLSGSGIMPPISPRIHSGGTKLPTYVTLMAQRRRIGHEPNEITLDLDLRHKKQPAVESPLEALVSRGWEWVGIAHCR